MTMFPSRAVLTRRLVLLGVPSTSLSVAACSAADLITPSPPDLFTLTPKSSFTEIGEPVDWQLLIETPSAPAAIDTTRIVLARSPTTIEYFANVAWVDRAPLLVQTLMLESFENSRRIVAIGREGLALRADFILRTELREFQAEFSNADPRPFAHIRMIARLVLAQRRSIEAIESFTSRVQASDTSFPTLIAAFDASLGPVLRQLVDWTLREGVRVRREIT